jgi:UDP-N-acetylmuramyl pentapeptide phosphotransferase/UDP-N-acetylglucosamine-1-phosphate transferase
MDGVNGITALHAVAWGLAFTVLMSKVGWSDLVPVSLILAAIGVAFLPWNAPSARIFLGDSGSYLVGGLAGMLALAGILTGEPIAALCPLATYAADTGSAVVRRFRSGEKLTEAHKTHVFQRLVDGGWGHMRVAVTTVCFTGASAALGLATVGAASGVKAVLLLSVLALNGLYLLLPRLTSGEYGRTRGGR